ncbi:exodeoxyribonuclease VII large subunit [Chenggangzhangella methanolivorans]|uniref:Exodeoxyribonuclease 7 large subunit n=1 Tax=Chenggangzhangella methanolivorans TaxID=1437009 RepID=A0A9E6RD02_9HYPH|nr:exodeoxyribonuclease VII large subunit [Chenggangzhangella methanolivorans]QZO01560.1 exodeoxyribonuclease VII large subunit [Chenggangzhangella methanolivorans]
MTTSPTALSNAPELSVSELSQSLKRTVEDTFGYVRVRGEISGYRGPHSSGHAYFALKDEGAKIDAVCWRGTFSKLKFRPEEGMEVVATGRLTTYPGKSAYQIVVDALEPAGVGALLAQLEERRRRLGAEGLFADERKRPLPFLPEVVGVVTSPTGAVIRDILHRLAERFPRRVLVWPVRVQGETAAEEVAAAIRGFNALAPGGAIPRPDVLIVARGGGSLEDLWSFNEEIVVRAAFESAIPLISAVGHETDTTLIDFASDRRAPTPTAAAEMAVPVRADLLATTADRGARLKSGILRGLEARRVELRSASRALPTLEALVQIPRQRLDHAAARLGPALATNAGRHRARLAAAGARLSPVTLRGRISAARERVDALATRAERARRALLDKRRAELDGLWKFAESLSYERVLDRGYALVRGVDGSLVRRASEIDAGQPLSLVFADGEAQAVATDGAAPPPQRPAKRKAEAQKTEPPRQDDLFG